MKKIIIVVFLFAFGVSPVLSQKKDKDIEDREIIQQIRISGLADILSFQNQNQGFSNGVVAQQVGNWNKSSVSQQADAGISGSNLVISIQQGNSHEFTVGQIGSGNLLLAVQSGYYLYDFVRNQGNHYGSGLENGNGNAFANGHERGGTGTFITGERNKLVISQEGNNNGIIAFQQGSDNSISSVQNGNNNYLLLLQKGNRNSISGYIQENLEISPNFDAIVQIGNDLSLSATDFSKSKPNGNSFRQEGENLSLQINNQFSNTLGGLEINQSGRDMKVVIDQSYFTLPMK